MRLRTYVPLTLIGLVPSIFLYVEAGTRLATLQRPSDIASPTLLAALFVVSLLPVLIKLLERTAEPTRDEPLQAGGLFALSLYIAPQHEALFQAA